MEIYFKLSFMVWWMVGEIYWIDKDFIIESFWMFKDKYGDFLYCSNGNRSDVE